MKHQIKGLLADTEAVIAQVDTKAKEAEKEWLEKSAPRFRELRDLLSERLRRGKVVTEIDVIAAFGNTDLDSWGPQARVFRDPRFQGRHATVLATVRTSRPNVKTSVTYVDLVGFAGLLKDLLDWESEDFRFAQDETPKPRFSVTDEELTSLGYSRFPAVISRLSQREIDLGSVVEVRV